MSPINNRCTTRRATAAVIWAALLPAFGPELRAQVEPTREGEAAPAEPAPAAAAPDAAAGPGQALDPETERRATTAGGKAVGDDDAREADAEQAPEADAEQAPA